MVSEHSKPLICSFVQALSLRAISGSAPLGFSKETNVVRDDVASYQEARVSRQASSASR